MTDDGNTRIDGEAEIYEALEATPGVHWDPFYPGGACMVWPDQSGWILTEDMAGESGFQLGIYDNVNDGDPPEATLLSVNIHPLMSVLRYLCTSQPEATNWAAWAAQRIDDDGLDATLGER